MPRLGIDAEHRGLDLGKEGLRPLGRRRHDNVRRQQARARVERARHVVRYEHDPRHRAPSFATPMVVLLAARIMPLWAGESLQYETSFPIVMFHI